MKQFRHGLYILLILLLCILISSDIKAQQLFTKSYSVENGLPTRIILDACQDSSGLMWFATYVGISKYDGFSFTNYDMKSGLPEQHYRKIRYDEKGILWAMPYIFLNNIVFYKDNVWTTIKSVGSNVNNNEISSFDVIYKEGKPVICVGSTKGLLYLSK